MSVVDRQDAIRPILVLTFTAYLLVILLWIVHKDIVQATLISSLAMFLFAVYGHAHYGMRLLIKSLQEPLGFEVQTPDLYLPLHALLLPVWIGIFLFGLWIIRRVGSKRDTLTWLFASTALVLIIVPAWKIIRYRDVWFSEFETTSHNPSAPISSTENPGSEALPDIYYIILDAYGREDILQEFYSFDNSQFVEALEEDGFFVAGRSKSNYSNTIISLASSLNMHYLDELIEMPEDRTLCRFQLIQLIHNSEILHILKENGYRIIAFSSGYLSTGLKDADIYIDFNESGANSFESMIFRFSAARPVLDILSFFTDSVEYPGYASHRDRINFIFDGLPDLADLTGPKFVFAHITAPHPPFVLGPEGEAMKPQYPYTDWDGDAFPGTEQEYLQGYIDQISYVNSSLIRVIDSLLVESGNPPIIILQGDHGPRSQVEWKSPSDDAIREAMGILNAYHFPGVEQDVFHDEITPVNTFRLLTNSYFNMDYELLSDKSYFSSVGCQGWFMDYPD
ncbi:MAG: sulfatase-like hydrolase/transferase [Anaerolineales bacterium]|nr:sulfatase-like hydrolase/transferase [Anaerolineales bacterium]